MSIAQFKISISRQIELLRMPIIVNVLIYLIYLYIIGLAAPLLISILYLSIFFLVALLPVAILHIQYWRANRSIVFAVDKFNKTIRYTSNSDVYEVDFSEIEALHYYASFGKDSWYTFSDYDYCRLIIKNKRSIIVTCLLMKNVKDVMEQLFSIKAEEHFSLLPLIKKTDVSAFQQS